MRLNTFLFVLLSILFFSSPLRAQFRYGAKAGMNISTLHFNKDIVSPDVLAGYSFGITSEWMSQRKNIGVELSALLSQRGITYHSNRYTTNYIDLPLNFKWRYRFLIGDIFLTAGPYVAFSIGEKQWDKISANGSPLATAKEMDFGVNVGVGMLLMNHFQVGMGYGYGLLDSYEVKRTSGLKSYAQNRYFTVNIGYLF